MILNLQRISFFKKISFHLNLLISLKNNFIYHSRFKNLYNDSQELKNLYSPSYPVLKLNHEGDSTCTSCTLCEQVCPTSAIKLSSTEHHGSLVSGALPKEFNLELELCRKCDLCRIVCPVDALSLNGRFEGMSGQVDLIEHSLDKKDHLS